MEVNSVLGQLTSKSEQLDGVNEQAMLVVNSSSSGTWFAKTWPVHKGNSPLD